MANCPLIPRRASLRSPTKRDAWGNRLRSGPYFALAIFLGLLAAFDCDFASAFFFVAHLWRIRSAAASRWAAENLRRFLFAGAGLAPGASVVSGFFGGL